MWSPVYLGPPDHITDDQGTGYISKEMKQNMSASVVTLRESQIENAGTIGTVLKYNSPLRAAYDKIRMEMDRDTSDPEFLTIAFFRELDGRPRGFVPDSPRV